MIKSLVISLAKKYAIGAVKDAISARKSDVAKWAEKVGLWIAKLRLVVAFLERLCARLADGELTDEEVASTTKELGVLAEEVTK